jgi:hypothetical protein
LSKKAASKMRSSTIKPLIFIPGDFKVNEKWSQGLERGVLKIRKLFTPADGGAGGAGIKLLFPVTSWSIYFCHGNTEDTEWFRFAKQILQPAEPKIFRAFRASVAKIGFRVLAD